MLKHIEKKKKLIGDRKSYLEQMRFFANYYENTDDTNKGVVENILKTLGRISILIKKDIDKI